MLERILLPYELDALEPYIDAETMDVHYNGHYKAYTDKANELLIKEQLIEGVDIVNWCNHFSPIDSPLRHHVGGWFNHSFYFEGLRKPGQIEDHLDFDVQQKVNPDALKDVTIEIATDALRGSGYVWLCLSKETKEMHVVSTQNQEITFMERFIPILNIDLWEHAYYLKHKNKKVDYINDLFEVINWEMVGKRLYEAKGE